MKPDRESQSFGGGVRALFAVIGTPKDGVCA